MVTIHEPWDNGAIEASMRSVFPKHVCDSTQRKTTKAMCGKRVAFNLAIPGHATCSECQLALKEQSDGPAE